jgi:tRNA modification GTPase
LEALTHHGARLAQPGEFSRRAFLNGKIDLSKAEAIARLIEAQSRDAARILARQLQGELGQFVDEIRETLLRALAHSEVLIDYAEEVEAELVEGLLTQLETLEKRIDAIVRSSHRRRGLIEGFRIAIIGKPNVGKSSLLNTFLAYERAIVSDIAGTTRDTIEERVRIGSHVVRLIDTAGIRDGGDTIERIGIERSLASMHDADIVIALFDGSRPFETEDHRIVDLIDRLPQDRRIVAITKSDLPQILDQKVLSRFAPISISTTRERTQALMDRLNTHMDMLGSGEDILLVSARQIEAVEACKKAITDAKQPLIDGMLELFSFHINEAITHIGTITRPHENHEILDRMFGEFCLGK